MRLFFSTAFVISFLIACNNNPKSTEKTPDQIEHIERVQYVETKAVQAPQTLYSHHDSLVLSTINDSLATIITDNNLEIEYIEPYKELSQHKVNNKNGITAEIFTWVDTTDYVIGFIESPQNKLAVVGYNHKYKIIIQNVASGHNIEFKVDKHKDIDPLLYKDDVWPETNTDPWSLISFKPELDLLIFEYNINPRYNYGASYYIVFNMKGDIVNCGFNTTWGGDGADGEIQIIGNHVVTCHEVYDLRNNKARVFPNPVNQLKDESNNDRILNNSIHAMRVLGDNAIMVIYKRPGNELEENGFIYSFDLDEIQKFKYHGLFVEMDATLIENESYNLDTLILFDFERNKLLFIKRSSPYAVEELDIDKMHSVSKDSIASCGELVLQADYPDLEIRKNAQGKYYFFKSEYN